MAYDNIDLTRDGAVAIIQFDRPKALNALNLEMMTELSDAYRKLEADDEVGCVILTGNEKAFAAGADIKDMAEDEYLGLYRTVPQTYHRRCSWLCSGRRMRGRHDVRLHHCRG